jgi:hypothetical protein
LLESSSRSLLDSWAPQRGNRRFATAAAEAAEPVASLTPALLVVAPKREEMDPEEHVELLGVDEARIRLTERAAEVRIFCDVQSYGTCLRFGG